MIFKNRQEAGKLLAEKMTSYQNSDAVVYALPRGGVVVGFEIAKVLNIPLNIAIVQKIGHPYNPEYAVCALSEGGDLVCSEDEISEEWPEDAVEEGKKEINAKIQHYRIFVNFVSPKGKTAILVDDGMATGLTMKAAIKWIEKEGAGKIVVAIPVAPKDVAENIKREVDELVALLIPEYFIGSVGSYYEDFDQVSDNEVGECLKKIS